MSEKKSLTQQNPDRRMSKPLPPKTTNIPDPVLAGADPRSHAAAARGPAVLPPNQLGSFEAAMKLFHARQLKDARELFVEAARGPERDVANRAQLHIAMCDRRLLRTTVNLGSAEDYYNYGVALINSRNLAEARAHLEKGLEMSPAADHIHYALALAQALDGDLSSAHHHLKRAIELEPRNRLIARQDADFAPLASLPPFDALIYPERFYQEKKSW
jgi:tetratricopeptide (TPR) repeat protein